MASRSIFTGSKTKLAIAIDIGTTYSGASYTFLNPGEVPRIFDVTGFKGQENKESNTKVPSILLYTSEGELLACGAETKQFEAQDDVIRTEWFKLELRPATMRIDRPPVSLPPNRTIVEVLGDFLQYMCDCVRTHIIKTHIDGNQLWSSLRNSAHFILSHPNGWGSFQQSKMREAAIRGGLVPNTPAGGERIEFVTEGEASFHWCVEQAITENALKARKRTNIIVADLGGGTIDVSSFQVATTKPLRLRETATPDCAVEGSITVSERFVKAIQARLQGTKYSDADYMEALREAFDDETKCLFRDEGNETLYVRIGGRRDHYQDENDLCKIKFGLLEIKREEVVQAFEPSVRATVNAIRKHLDGKENAHVFLVGGFAASPWVLSETKRRLRSMGITNAIKRADSNTAKAVAHGGIAFYLDRYVTERTMRFTYGLNLQPYYDPSDPQHVERAHMLTTDPISGITAVRGGFFPLVKKGQLVKVDSVYRERVVSDAYRIPESVNWEQSIERYTGSRKKINFVDMDPHGFDQIGWFDCEIPATALTKRIGKHGAYWAVDYEVVITLGTVEIKCHVEWEEGGVKRRTPANKIWEDYY